MAVEQRIIPNIRSLPKDAVCALTINTDPVVEGTEGYFFVDALCLRRIEKEDGLKICAAPLVMAFKDFDAPFKTKLCIACGGMAVISPTMN